MCLAWIGNEFLLLTGPEAGRHFPAALLDQPIHVRADGIRKRLLDRRVRNPLFAVRLGDRKHNHRWLLRRIGSERLERDVAGLRGLHISRHDRRKRALMVR